MLKSMMLTVVVAGSALAWSSARSVQDAANTEWVEAIRLDVSKERTQPEPGSAAMGTSAFPFDIGGATAGALFDRLEGKGFVVFIGMSVPRKLVNNAIDDVRAEFRVGDGEAARWIAVRPGARAGSTAATYRPPADVPEADLREFRLLYNPRAAWTHQLAVITTVVDLSDLEPER